MGRWQSFIYLMIIFEALLPLQAALVFVWHVIFLRFTQSSRLVIILRMRRWLMKPAIFALRFSPQKLDGASYRRDDDRHHGFSAGKPACYFKRPRIINDFIFAKSAAHIEVPLARGLKIDMAFYWRAAISIIRYEKHFSILTTMKASNFERRDIARSESRGLLLFSTRHREISQAVAVRYNRKWSAIMKDDIIEIIASGWNAGTSAVILTSGDFFI